MLEAETPLNPWTTDLKSLTPGQIAAIRAIPRHDRASAPAIDARRPASIFVDQAHFDLEQARVFRRLPVPVTASSLLPESGAILTHEGYGKPLLLMRGKNGELKAFLNACKHKGAKLINACEGRKLGKLTCPYHAWTYALDGRLVGVPREETLKNFSKEEFGLTPLSCREAGGVVWVQLDPEAAPDFRSLVPELEADLNALRLPSAHVYGRRTFEVAANWKAVLEPFLEGYHVQRLHARSIGNMFADAPTITHHLGHHTRQVSGKAHFVPEMLDASTESIHKVVTHAYHLFPNAVVVTSPYYISLMIIMPQSAEKSIVEYFMLTPTTPDGEKSKELYQRSYELVLKVFGEEDFHAAELCQTGLKSGALQYVVYCGLEQAIPQFYDKLEEELVG